MAARAPLVRGSEPPVGVGPALAAVESNHPTLKARRILVWPTVHQHVGQVHTVVVVVVVLVVVYVAIDIVIVVINRITSIAFHELDPHRRVLQRRAVPSDVDLGVFAAVRPLDESNAVQVLPVKRVSVRRRARQKDWVVARAVRPCGDGRAVRVAKHNAHKEKVDRIAVRLGRLRDDDSCDDGAHIRQPERREVDSLVARAPLVRCSEPPAGVGPALAAVESNHPTLEARRILVWPTVHQHVGQVVRGRAISEN